MWGYAVAAGTTTTACACFYYRNRLPIRHGPLGTLAAAPVTRLELSSDVEDLIVLLQDIARRAPTEDVVDRLSSSIDDYGISERCLLRLSALHRTHGSDIGIKGYAINLVWSTAADAVNRGALVHCDDQ